MSPPLYSEILEGLDDNRVVPYYFGFRCKKHATRPVYSADSQSLILA